MEECISFVVLKCPKCDSMIDPDRCDIDEKGRGHCYRCGKHLFTDRPKKRAN